MYTQNNIEECVINVMNEETILSFVNFFGILELLPTPYRPFNNFLIEHVLELDLKSQQKNL